MSDPLFYHIDNGNPKTHRLKALVDGEVKVIWELESIDLVNEKIDQYNLANNKDPGVTHEIEVM
jgi:hypothetical protein